MQVYNLIEYSKKYSKNSGNLWQHCRDEPAEDDFGNNVSFVAINTISSFQFTAKITGQTGDNST